MFLIEWRYVQIILICICINFLFQVIKMLVAVVLIFMICWGPIMTNNLLVAFRVLNDLNEGPMRPMRIAFFLMSYFNSCTNPLVYAFMSRHFRNTFKQTLFILCKKYTNVHHHHLTAKYSCDTRSVSFHTGKSLHVINDATDKDKVLNGYNVSRGNSHWTNARKKRPSKNEIELHNIKLKNTLMTDSRV